MAKKTNKKTTNEKKSLSKTIFHLRTQNDRKDLEKAFVYSMLSAFQAMNPVFMQAATEVFNMLFRPQPRRRLRRKLKFIRKQELSIKPQPRLEIDASHDRNRD